MTFNMTFEIQVTGRMAALSDLAHLVPGDPTECMVQGSLDGGEVADLYVEVEGVDVTEWISKKDGERIYLHVISE